MNAWLCGVADGKRRGPKSVLSSGRSCTPCGNDRYTVPSLHCEREMLTRIRAGKVTEKNPERTDILEETPDVHGVQKWYK
jgi:hypothetical protein